MCACLVLTLLTQSSSFICTVHEEMMSCRGYQSSHAWHLLQLHGWRIVAEAADVGTLISCCCCRCSPTFLSSSKSRSWMIESKCGRDVLALMSLDASAPVITASLRPPPLFCRWTLRSDIDLLLIIFCPCSLERSSTGACTVPQFRRRFESLQLR